MPPVDSEGDRKKDCQKPRKPRLGFWVGGGFVVALIGFCSISILTCGPDVNFERKQIAIFLAELEGGLEDYRIDHGSYPLNPPDGRTQVEWNDDLAKEGARVLYQHLSGDFDMDGQLDPGANFYVDRLDFWSNSDRNGTPTPQIPRSAETEGGFQVLDPSGSPVRYLAEPLDRPAAERHTHNQSFDLWSIGAKPDPEDESRWIRNWNVE